MAQLPSILFHRGTNWNGAVRGSTNVLASAFREAGYSVSWLGRPRHAGHALLRGQGPLATTWTRHDDGVLEIRPFTAVPIVKSTALGPQIWMRSAQLGYRSIMPSLPKILAHASQPIPDLIWTSGGDGGILRRIFPGARSIMQCVDVYEAYAGVTQNRLEDEDYAQADAIIAIGHSLARYLCAHRGLAEDRISVIGQGADMDLFSQNLPVPQAMKALPHPRLIWVGVLAKVDPALMAAALEALPKDQGSLILIGPHAPWVDEFCARDPRAHWLGPKPADEVAAYLKHSSIGLMLYNRDVDPRIYQGQNPLKLYEMAAAGLSIVTTTHAEFDFTTPPAQIADTPAEVAQAVKSVLPYVTPNTAALSFAKTNSWHARFKEAEALVQAVLSDHQRPPGTAGN